MKYYSKMPKRGDFRYQTLVGPYEVSGASLHDLRGFFGLRLNKSMPFGVLRSDDGEIFAVVRALAAPGGVQNPTKFIYQSTLLDGEHLRIDRKTISRQAATDLPVMALEGDVASWASRPEDSGNPWRITASGERMTWVEDGLFDISGSLIGSGFQWYLPGYDWGTFYVSQLYDMQGICDGRNVKGVIALDQAYLADGGAVHFAKDMVVNNKKHVIWWSFATIYKDGSFDAGSIMVGHDHLGYAILMDQSGVVRTTTNVEGKVIHKDNSYFAKEIRVVIEGDEEWEFLPDPRGEMIDFVGGFPITAQQEGRWRRVGDTREPDRWMAWGESDRRNGTARNVFGNDI